MRLSFLARFAFLLAVILPAVNGAVFADQWVKAGATVYYSPRDDLRAVDIELIGRARKTIDFAAYELTSVPVIDALAKAAERGVAVRIYLDRSRIGGFQNVSSHNLLGLTPLRRPGVEIRVKRRGAAMRLNAYAIDGVFLRTGSSGFSSARARPDDADLAILNSGHHAGDFIRNFDDMWGRTGNSRY